MFNISPVYLAASRALLALQVAQSRRGLSAVESVPVPPSERATFVSLDTNLWHKIPF